MSINWTPTAPLRLQIYMMAFYSDRFVLGESSSFVDDSSYNEDYSDVGTEPLCSTPVTHPTWPHRQPLQPHSIVQFDNIPSSSPHAYSSASSFYPAPSHMQGDVLTSLLASQNKTLKVLENFQGRFPIWKKLFQEWPQSHRMQVLRHLQNIKRDYHLSEYKCCNNNVYVIFQLTPIQRTVALVQEALDEQDQF